MHFLVYIHHFWRRYLIDTLHLGRTIVMHACHVYLSSKKTFSSLLAMEYQKHHWQQLICICRLTSPVGFMCKIFYAHMHGLALTQNVTMRSIGKGKLKEDGEGHRAYLERLKAQRSAAKSTIGAYLNWKSTVWKRDNGLGTNDKRMHSGEPTVEKVELICWVPLPDSRMKRKKEPCVASGFLRECHHCKPKRGSVKS